MDINPISLCSVHPSASPPDEPVTINHLPPEILSDIFHTYMFTEDESDLIDPALEAVIPVFLPSSHTAPLLFCQVCRFWRNVATLTPSLWSSIAIGSAYQLTMIRIWLDRSRNHPLSFHIQINARVASLDKLNEVPQLFDILYAHVHRWENVSISLPPSLKTDLFRFLSVMAPSGGQSPALLLKSLYIARILTVDLRGEPLDNLAACPHPELRRFAWNYEFMPPFQALENSLWTNLQQMTFATTTTRILFSVLETCENLRFITIDIFRAERGSSLPQTVVVAPNLQVLNITRITGHLAHTLNFMCTPRLTKFSLFEIGLAGQYEALEKFLKRSRCCLETAFLGYCSRSFSRREAHYLLQSPYFTIIPKFSLRIYVRFKPSSFAESIISEAHHLNSSRENPYAWYESRSACIFIGWGSLNYIRTFDSTYPFLVQDPSHVQMLWLPLREEYQDPIV